MIPNVPNTTRRRRWLARMVVVVLALVAASCGGGDDDSASLPTSVDPTDVVREERVFVDPSRPTRANGPAPASDHRTLITALWFAPTALATPACTPAAGAGSDGVCALVLLAHGFGGSTSRFDAIARKIAAAGYVVAAPAFPLTNEDAPGGHLSGLDDVAQQPRDLSVVTDALLAANADAADRLHRRIDGGRIGAVGHSLGGATLLGATRSSCCTDPWLDAAVLVAPAAFLVEGVFGAPAATGPPTLVINGSDDPLVAPVFSRQLAHSFAAPWYYLEIEGGGHSSVIENTGDPPPTLLPTARAVVAFFDEYLGGDVGTTAATLDALAADGHDVEIAE